MQQPAKLRNVVFLDRDGVINQDTPEFVKTWGDFSFIPESLEAIARLSAAGHPIIVISNQSGVGRGLIQPDELDRIFSNMRQAVTDAGGRILDIFYCPHVPEDHCDCRKPRTGMIEKAAKKHGIDLSTACLVGDRIKDIKCARNAGCALAVLVTSGYDRTASDRLSENGVSPDLIAANLNEAATWIIAQYQSGRKSNPTIQTTP